MGLSFLSEEINTAIDHLNGNYLSEIRLRRGQPVIIEYRGAYAYLGRTGLSLGVGDRLTAGNLDPVINSATGGSVYAYTEQLKNGFITVGHGVRIGIAGEYVTERGEVLSIRNITSLNIRIPHDVTGCAEYVCRTLYSLSPQNTLIFSRPGLGKTTVLRDIARFISRKSLTNVLVLDERNEIAAMDAYGEGFDLGLSDVVRCGDKLGSISSAIRAMKPDVIITDELYGENDLKAVKYAVDCGITVIASSHITDKNILIATPFDYFVKLSAINCKPEIYDKNFNPYSYCGTDDSSRRNAD